MGKPIATKVKHYHVREKQFVYIALEDVRDSDFFWSLDEIQRFDELWFEDMPMVEIAYEMRRTELSVFLLAIDRVYSGRITPREWKLF